MARIPFVDPEDPSTDAAVREYLSRATSLTGSAPNVLRALANHPEALLHGNGRLTDHFDVPQIIELCMTIGLSNQVNRFHATFLTDVDERISDTVAVACPLPLPPLPGGERPGTEDPSAVRSGRPGGA